MQAAVWRGGEALSLERLSVPAVSAGELLVRIEACALCPTDIKKIDLELAAPPLVLGHEMVGRVVAAGAGAGVFDNKRVVVYHHIPCKNCRLCALGLYSQCEGYKRTGTTAGFTPAGGGWAGYVRVMPWIVEGGGVVEVPETLPFEAAVLMEPLNTCLKCVQALPPPAGEVVILGQGPVGLMLTALCRRSGWKVSAVEPVAERRDFALSFGAEDVFAPGAGLSEKLSSLSGGAGPDAVIAATDHEGAIAGALESLRFGGTMILFAHTRLKQPLAIDGGEIGKAEKRLIGSYSSSVELNPGVAEILCEDPAFWKRLVTHVFPLHEINQALELARHPQNGSLKIAVHMGLQAGGKGA